MMDWLSKVDPNVAIALLTALATFVYHQLSPATQAKVEATAQDIQKTALDLADQVMAALIAVAPAGTTRADLEAQLWTAAKVQLQHIGLDPDKLPPAVLAAAKSLVDKYISEHFAGPKP